MMKMMKMKTEQGYSLVELVIAVSIMGILLTVATGVLLLHTATISRLFNETLLRWEVRKTMQLLRNDIQRLQADALLQEKSGKFANTRLHYKDLEGNQVQYRKQKNGLFQQKKGGGDWKTLLYGVTGDTFQFLDSELNPIDHKEDVTFIEVTFQVSQNNIQISLRDRFYVRN